MIAAVNGVAVGAGLDFALMCDMRFMARSARLSEGYIRVGLVPGDTAERTFYPASWGRRRRWSSC